MPVTPGRFLHPEGIATDLAGNVVVADTLNDRIQVLSAETGEPLLVFGRAGNGAGEFHHPAGVAVEAETGNIVVTDTQNNRVQVFSSAGAYLKTLQHVSRRADNLSAPHEAIVLPGIGMVITDMMNDRLVGGTEGTALDSWSELQVEGLPLRRPHGLAFDRVMGLLYVADTGNHRVVAIPTELFGGAGASLVLRLP